MKKIDTVIVIPTRWGSTRFPGKFLTPILGRPMVIHMVERALAVKKAYAVCVASDDERILNEVEHHRDELLASDDNQHRLRTFRSRRAHSTGTDRMLEVSEHIPADIFVNLQSDEPLVCPEDIDRLIQMMQEGPDILASTMAHPIRDVEDLHNPHVVKVTIDSASRAIYFSRSPIPHPPANIGEIFNSGPFWRHLGVYAYRVEGLIKFGQLLRSPLELIENLEQLRWLEKAGEPMFVLKTQSTAIAVDTPGDIERVENELRKNQDMRHIFQKTFLEAAAELSRLGSTAPPDDFSSVVKGLVNSPMIITSGMGKSGIIATKLASTLKSLGLPAHFLHPAEAPHGEMGMVKRGAFAILISQEGHTQEVIQLAEHLKEFGTTLAAITGAEDSPLAKRADWLLLTPVENEGIDGVPAPLISSVAAMVMGDALAVAVAKVKGITADIFRRTHPAGKTKTVS